MPWVAAAAAVVGGVVASDASRSAANTQADAAKNATQTQKDMFDQTNAQQAPWREAGQTALSDMLYGFGHGTNAPATSSAAPSGALGMWMGNGPPPGYALSSPATNQISHPGMTSGQFNHQFNADDLKTNLSPSYNFMLGQGLSSVNNQASVKGGLVGGNALKGINDYAQNYASNGYQQAYDNYTTNQDRIFNRLASIAGLGQTANGQSAQAGLGYASNIGSGQLAAGAASAAGTVGSANAISNGLNNAAGWYSTYGGSGTPITDSQVQQSHTNGMADLNAQANAELGK